MWSLVYASVFTAISLVVAGWGLTALGTGTHPVESPISEWVAPVIVAVCAALTLWTLWQQSLQLLRGDRTLPLGWAVTAGLGSYLIWCVFGSLAGMTVQETWLSWYAWELVPAMAVVNLLCWLVLFRRVYTDRPTPQWPWEKREAAEREAERLDQLWDQSSDHGDTHMPPEERL